MVCLVWKAALLINHQRIFPQMTLVHINGNDENNNLSDFTPAPAEDSALIVVLKTCWCN